ncbi:MAG: cob(I)yrinic acid a,c-diamide adenosyltransferase [Candidatus Omnitrophica bacterium]|nr:cob(I)yrinic acid a,c-diamide adenosyltransferase [Candidatus Omnitrophota bacterium]
MALSPQEKPHYTAEQRAKKKGLIIVHTGDGKGKTTAALGIAFRAAGNDMRVVIIQFIKGKWKYGELESARQLKTPIEIHQAGEGFTWDTKNPARDIEMTQKGWVICKEKMLSGKYNVVVFDEINYVIDYGYLNVKEVVSALKQKPEMVHVILTGRNAKPELVEIADLVTEMKEIKHPFKEQGIIAPRGIEF